MFEQIWMEKKKGGIDQMVQYERIEDVIKVVSLVEHLYSGARILDPMTKKVFHLSQNLTCSKVDLCYDFWNTDHACSNCVSIRAIREDHSTYKIASNDEGIYMVTTVPIQVGELLLVIEFFQNVTGNLCFDDGGPCDDTNQLMLSVSRHVEKLMSRDRLTGLYNRRYADETLPAELIAAYEEDKPLSVILADLDDFKVVNDTYGHGAGDKVIKVIGQIMQQNLRSGIGWAARYGGEKFLICLPGVEREGAWAVAERLRKLIQKRRFDEDEGEGTFYLTCSFGIQTASTHPYRLSIEELISLADRHLCQAKAEGRNQVV